MKKRPNVQFKSLLLVALGASAAGACATVQRNIDGETGGGGSSSSSSSTSSTSAGSSSSSGETACVFGTSLFGSCTFGP